MKINYTDMEHEILKILFDDDVVRYIAERHHVSSEVLIKDFFSNETGNTFKLLNNEIEIIRGLKTKLERILYEKD